MLQEQFHIMEGLSAMNKQISKEIFQEIANELGVNPAFIEKDWYAVQLLKSIETIEFNGYRPIFAGGTSLSKGYGLIERFSEDLDFKFVNTSSLNRDKRKQIRQQFIDVINSVTEFKITDENIKVRNEGKNCCIYVQYHNNIDFPSFLRPYLQVELFFDEENLSYEPRKIQSFVSQYSNDKYETTINCIKPFNTAADKFNALSWRVYNKENTDYTLLRHLHDLYAIRSYISDYEAFKERVIRNFETKDKPRLHNPDIQFNNIVSSTIELLEANKQFRKGYEEYVEVMSYAKVENRVKFSNALEYYKRLSKLF